MSVDAKQAVIPIDGGEVVWLPDLAPDDYMAEWIENVQRELKRCIQDDYAAEWIENVQRELKRCIQNDYAAEWIENIQRELKRYVQGAGE